MSASAQIAGFNTRYAKERFKGANGDKGANIFPYQHEEQVIAVDPAGASDSVNTILAGSATIQVLMEVTEAFNGAATIIVGYAGDTDFLVTLADAIDLTTTGLKKKVVELTWPGTAAFRVTIGGAPNQGRVVVTFQFQN